MVNPKTLDYQDLISKLSFCIKDHRDRYSFISLVEQLGDIGLHYDREIVEVIDILKSLGYKCASIDDQFESQNQVAVRLGELK